MVIADQDPFEMGRKGYDDGHGIDNNPFEEGTQKSRERWQEGWISGLNEMKARLEINRVKQEAAMAAPKPWHYINSIECFPRESERRIPDQVSTVLCQATNTMAVFVIADDGTMWRSIQSGGGYQWVRVPDLPQPSDEKPLATPGAAR